MKRQTDRAVYKRNIIRPNYKQCVCVPLKPLVEILSPKVTDLGVGLLVGDHLLERSPHE
jgi:hypothetical protein